MNTKQTERHIRLIREKALAELSQETNATPKPPSGWHTSKQLSKAIGCSSRNALHIVSKWMDSGFVLVDYYSVQCGQTFRRTPHYALHPKLASIYGLQSIPKLFKK